MENDGWRLITNRYPSTCSSCNGVLDEREEVWWKKGKGATHMHCSREQVEFKKEFINKYPVKCKACNKKIKVGASIWWSPEKGCRHLECG